MSWEDGHDVDLGDVEAAVIRLEDRVNELETLLRASVANTDRAIRMLLKRDRND